MSTRVRSKGSLSFNQAQKVGLAGYKLEACNNNPGWAFRQVDQTAPGLAMYTDTRETISDTIGAWGYYNPVTHTKAIPYRIGGGNALARKVDPVPPWWTPGQWFTYGWAAGFSIGNSISFQGMKSGGPGNIPSPSWASIDWSTLVSTVGQQLDGHMLIGQNLLVDLIQIAQTIGMVKNPFGLLKKVPKLLKGAPMRKVHREVAGTYLEYKFGWENLYRSVVALATVWGEARRHEEYLKESAGKYTPLSAQSRTEYTNGSSLYPLVSLGDELRGGVLELRVTRCEQIARFSLNVRRSQAALALTRGDLVLDRLGAGGLAEALWDVVPYSFVVDWFTHINREFKKPPISWSGRELRRLGFSITRKWYGEVTLRSRTYTNTSGWGVPELKPLGEQCIQEQYTRYEGFPPSTSSVGLFGNLSKTQIAEGLALIVQRI